MLDDSQLPRMLGGDGQTDEDRELAAHVREKVEEIRSSASRVAHEAIWLTNCAYTLGADSVYYSAGTQSFQSLDRAGIGFKKNRIHVNKILPTLQNRLARLCKNPPRYDVRPESNSNDDKEASRLALQILTALWDKLRLNELRIPLYMWVQEAGHAYMKISWDPSEGQMMPGSTEYEGEVRADFCSPFEIFPNPLAKTFDDVRRSWLIQAKVRPLDYFKTHYEKGDLVKQEDAWLLSAMYEQRINSLNNRGPSAGGMLAAMKNSAIELIKYEARSEKFPMGRMLVSASGIQLEDKELPLGEIPFAMFTDVQVAGKYYAESIVTHLRPVQDQYNELIRRRAAWVRKFVSGKYKAARGMGLAEESLHDGESEVVMFDAIPGSPNGPEAIAIPALPAWTFSEEDRYNSQFNEIAGLGEVEKGNAPSSQIPAIGMQLLVEQNDTRIGVVTEQHEHSWARIGQLILKAVAINYQIPRKFKIAGPSLTYTVKKVTGDMLKGHDDVYVIRGSTLPGSKTLNNQNIMNAYQMGLLGDPNDPKLKEKVLGLIEFGDVQGIWQDYGLDMAQIKRGMEGLEQGQDVQVNEFDNHALWLQELNRFRKGEKFMALPPQIQQLMDQQMEFRVQALMHVTGNNPPAPPPPEMGAGPPPGPGGPPPPQGAPQ